MASQLDLLREKRQELNLPEPAEASIQGRRWLLQGVVIGAALVGVSLGVAVLVFLRALIVSSAIEALDTVEAEVQLFETQLNASRAKLNGVTKANQDLVKGLLAVRSGSAVPGARRHRVDLHGQDPHPEVCNFCSFYSQAAELGPLSLP